LNRSCGSRHWYTVNKVLYFIIIYRKFKLPTGTTGPATHQRKQKCPSPTGSKAMPVQAH